MEGKSEAEQQAVVAQTKGRADAKKVSDEDWTRAYQAYKEAKRQAHIVHKKARKIAVDKQAKKEADEAHKKAIEQAKKLRDAITAEAMVVFRCSYDKADADHLETQIKSEEASKDGDETYREASKEADIVYKEAKQQAVDKQAKKEAAKAHKEAIKQAEKDYREAKTRLQ